MDVLVSGSSGLIGSAVVDALSTSGHRVRRLVRSEPAAGDVRWDIAAGSIDHDGLRGVHAAVHLAGEPFTSRRWSQAQHRRVLSSRVDGTRLLSEALAAMPDPPAVLVAASAIGYYGERGDDVLTEEEPPGAGVLADICRAWEAATQPAEAAGIRVVHIRTGIVLSPRGGALARQLPLFRLGLGGRLATGKQFVSWISLDDEVAAIVHLLEDGEARGPVNLTAPEPVRNSELTAALARVLRRPALLPVPRTALRAVLGGDLADNLLQSQRVVPSRLLGRGFGFRHPELHEALRAMLA